MSKVFQISFLAGLVLLPRAGWATSEAPLPPVKQVIERALERAEREDENDRQFKQRYYYVRSRLTEIRNAKGDIKKSKLKIYTNAPVATVIVPALQPPASIIADPSESDEETNSEVPAEVQAEVSHKFDKDEIQFNQDLLSRFDFKLVGREQTNGCRSLLVVDFTPKKKKLPEKGIQDRVINRMAGRIWVDEQEFAIKKCALRLTKSISVLGGIVGEAQKFQYGFERERTPDGLWYVRDSSWHLEGRLVVVHREADYHEKWTEVRKSDAQQELTDCRQR